MNFFVHIEKNKFTWDNLYELIVKQGLSLRFLGDMQKKKYSGGKFAWYRLM